MPTNLSTETPLEAMVAILCLSRPMICAGVEYEAMEKRKSVWRAVGWEELVSTWLTSKIEAAG